MRVNFNYFISETVFSYIVEAVHLVAREGYRLLPDYTFDAHTGQWRHREGAPRATMSLRDLSYRSGKLEFRARMHTEPEWTREGHLVTARKTLAAAADRPRHRAGRGAAAVGRLREELRWFPLPGGGRAAPREEGEGGRGVKRQRRFDARHAAGRVEHQNGSRRCLRKRRQAREPKRPDKVL